eukprot:2050251-Pyramimonas_sp.AAC.1
MVSGDIAGLLNVTSLQRLDVSNSQVSGVITSVWARKMQHLSIEDAGGASPAAPWEFAEVMRSIESRDAARMPAIK